MKFLLLTAEVVESESKVVRSFLDWQRKQFNEITDHKRLVITTEGKPKPVLFITCDFNKEFDNISLVGFETMYKYFKDNGLMIAI